MRQLRVEITRFGSRRAVAAILVAAAAIATLLAASAAYDTRPANATERAAAEQLLLEQRASGEQEYDECLRDPVAYSGPGSTAEDCARARPRIDWFLPREELDLRGELEGRGTVLMVLLAGAAVLVGATFAGADWASGSISNQLLFEPRRLRLWFAKAVTVTLGTALAGTLVLAAFWGALGAVASSRGQELTDAVRTLLIETSGRGVALVAGVTLGSFALTMLLRHTGGTLGVLFGYAVVSEVLAASLPFERMSRWSLANTLLAWLEDGTQVFDPSICGEAEVGCSTSYTLPLSHAAAYLGALLLLAIVVSVVVFRRRDVP